MNPPPAVLRVIALALSRLASFVVACGEEVGSDTPDAAVATAIVEPVTESLPRASAGTALVPTPGHQGHAREGNKAVRSVVQ